MTHIFLAGVIIISAATGCRAPLSTCHPRNIVAIDAQGSLLTPKTNKNGSVILAPTEHPDLTRVRRLVSRSPKAEAARTAKRQDYYAKSRQYLDDIFNNNPVLNQHSNITIFIHGGLNEPDASVNRADLLADPILSDTNVSTYPIFVCWNSSLISAWGEQYYTHRGRNDLLLGAALAPFTFTANLGRYLTRLPLSVFEQGYAGFRTFRAPVYGESTKPRRLLGRPESVNDQFNRLKADGYKVQLSESSSLGPFRRRSIMMIAGALPKILTEGLVDTGGKVGWDFMLRRTQTMFTLADSFDPGGMEFFCRDLIKYAKSRPDLTITVIGHSMGAIVANELIRRHGNELPIANIIYMAAACGTEDFEHDVLPYLFAHRETQFYNLSLHPGNDTSELPGAWLAPVSPRGSLLDWIDFYYSSKDTDYGWSFGKWDNAILGTKRFIYQQAPRTQQQLQAQIHMKAFGFGPDAHFGPQHHGGFDQWKFWQPRFWQLSDYMEDWHHSFLDHEPCAKAGPKGSTHSFLR
jgi:pimeloyl-ACP methyl ester carboxylesterase